MKERSEERIRAVISAIFAFLLFVCMAAILLCIGAAGIFSESHLNRSQESSNYAAQSFQQLQKELTSEAEAHGLPEDLLSQQVTKKFFDRTFSRNIEKACSGAKKQENDIRAKEYIEKKEKNAITAYLAEKNVGENEKLEEAVDEIAAECAAYFDHYTSFPFGVFFSEYKTDLFSWFKYLLPGCIIMAAVLLFLLFRIHGSFAAGGSYALSSFLATAFISLIIGFILRFGIHNEISRSFPAYESFVDIFWKAPSVLFWINGLCMTVISILGIIILNNLRKGKYMR